MPIHTLPICQVLFVGTSVRDAEILSQLGHYCSPVPCWADEPAHAVALLQDRDWGLILLQLDPDPESALGVASIFARGVRCDGGHLPPRIGLTSREIDPLSFLSSAAGLDSIITLPCKADLWARWLSPPVAFDPDDLIERLMGNEELAKRIVGVFLEDAPRQLMALHEALRVQDPALGGMVAHSLRGAASAAGGDALLELARGIETASNAGHFDQVATMLPRLEARFARLRPLLEQFSR